MDLIIVESPTKAKTLKKYLGKGYQVEASMGHIRDLPKSKLAVDVDDNFEPQYIQVRGKSKVVSRLKQLASEAKQIYLAMDPDREGEAIAWHTQTLLTEKKTSKQKTKVDSRQFKRVTFHEVTKQAVMEALSKPGTIDMNRVDAQQARRVLDRLVGYKLSPLLWRKVRRGLSAGRVQSVALRMIVERETEIEAYKPQEYWDISVLLDGTNTLIKKTEVPQQVASVGELGKMRTEQWLQANLIEVEGKKVLVIDPKKKSPSKKELSESIQITNEEIAKPIIADLPKCGYAVESVDTLTKKRRAKPPFTTSTLQQAAASRFSFSGKQTMSIAQRLFEAGLITYHRTDSLSLAGDFVTTTRNYIAETFTSDYLPTKPVFYKTKSKSAQEAHEAIRPTDISRKVEQATAEFGLDSRQAKLYELIWQRTIACQMKPAIYDQTTVLISAQGEKKYGLKATGSVITFDGWMVVYGKHLASETGDVPMPQVKPKQDLEFVTMAAEQKQTLPPPRFNDASLVKELERLGIGRPSTYASIIGVLDDRGYVERIDKRFFATDIGKVVVEFLRGHFDQVMDYDFTAQMEDSLDEIAQGDKKWRQVIGEFYKPFEKKLEDVGEKADRVEIPVEKTGETCPECKQGEIIIRTGRYGKFYACDRYPECKYTKQFVETLDDFACPECGQPVVVKRTRRGRMFYGCSGYPTCEWASWKDPRPNSSGNDEADSN